VHQIAWGSRPKLWCDALPELSLRLLGHGKCPTQKKLRFSPGRGWRPKAGVSTTVLGAGTTILPRRGLLPCPDVSTSGEMPTGFPPSGQFQNIS